MDLMELRAAVLSYAARGEDELPLATFIRLAETKFTGTVKHRLAEREVEIAVARGARSFPLPADYQEARSLKIAGRPITLASIDALDTTPGVTDRFAIVGSTVRLQAAALAPLTVALTYFARVPALTEAAPTNWLLATYPDVYLYGVLVEFATWSQDAERQSQYAALLGVALGNLAADHRRGAYSGSTLQARRFA